MKFPPPFTGKPTKPHLSGLFLLDPTVLMKLSGHPMQAMMKEELGEGLAKRMERALRDKTASPELLDALVDALPAGRQEIVEQFRRAAAGDATATSALSSMGPWESFYAGLTGPLSYGSEYRLRLEQASRPAEAAFLRSDRYTGAYELERAPLIQPLLWNDAIQALKQIQGVEDALAVQFAVAMEVELSCLAAMDAALCVDKLLGETIFSALLPDPAQENLNPPAMFFRWLQRATGLHTLAAIESRLRLAKKPIHLTTFKNWSRGSQIPNPSWLRLLVTLCAKDADRELAELLYWAAKMLNLLGYYSARFVEVARPRVAAAPWTPENPRGRLPLWPRFPFGYETFGEWARERYAYWLTYHRTRISVA